MRFRGSDDRMLAQASRGLTRGGWRVTDARVIYVGWTAGVLGVGAAVLLVILRASGRIRRRVYHRRHAWVLGQLESQRRAREAPRTLEEAYQALLQRGWIEGPGENYYVDDPDADAGFERWRADVLAPWFSRLSERADRDGYRLSYDIKYFNGHIDNGLVGRYAVVGLAGDQPRTTIDGGGPRPSASSASESE